MSTVHDREVLGAIDELRQALLELDCFGRMYPAEDLTPEKAKSLAETGTLSARLAAYIANSQVQFHGFRYRPIKADIPVLEATISRMPTPVRLIGYRDGHVEVQTSDQVPLEA
jgi:hypothetical protein